MVHCYKLGGLNIVLDICSGSVHVVDDATYDIIEMYESKSHAEITEEILRKYPGRPDATKEEIEKLIAFTKENGGIEYATQYMIHLVNRAHKLLDQCRDESVRQALISFIDYVVYRNK